jgi:hypothetical protein
MDQFVLDHWYDFTLALGFAAQWPFCGNCGQHMEYGNEYMHQHLALGYGYRCAWAPRPRWFTIEDGGQLWALVGGTTVKLPFNTTNAKEWLKNLDTLYEKLSTTKNET